MPNRGELMILPAGISKGTGLLAALSELGVSPHNVLAVGDAENDLALLQVAEIGVAVANAVPSLVEHADLVLEERNGAGVAALLAGPVLTGEQMIRPARPRIAIGRFVRRDLGHAAGVADQRPGLRTERVRQVLHRRVADRGMDHGRLYGRNS